MITGFIAYSLATKLLLFSAVKVMLRHEAETPFDIIQE